MANYFKELNEAFDRKYVLSNVVESKRNLKEAKNDGIFSMTLSEYADSQGVDVGEAESWVTLHPEKTISKLYFSEDEESPYTGIVYTDGTISVVGLRYDDDVKDFSTMRKVLLGDSEGEDKVYYPNGVECKDNSVDMDKALDYQYGTDRDKDNSKYTAEEKQRALNYWIWKADSLNKEPIEEASAVHAHPDMSKKEGSISSIILSNKDRIDSATSLQELRSVVADILSPVEGNAKVAEINGRLRAMKDPVKALQYIYNIILKGDNLGTIKTGKVKERSKNESSKISSTTKDNVKGKAAITPSKKPMNEDGAQGFLNDLSRNLLSDLWDSIFDEVADAAEDLGSLPDYLPMTEEEAKQQFIDAVYTLAEAAFIKYCVDHRDDEDYDMDEGIVKTLTQPIRDVADTVRDVLNIPDKNTKLDEDNGSLGNEIDRYQRWVDFDMSHYGKISKRTQDYINKAGYQIIKDDHGDYEVAAGHFE